MLPTPKTRASAGPEHTSSANAKVEAIVRAAGATVAATIGHASVPVHLVAGEDANRRVGQSVKATAGAVRLTRVVK